jgi:ADP-dependent NAD(P)H-hydrate dehydratase / NAD(P)H-hydrate epimerase
MKISTVAEMRELDRTASEQFGIKEELLMENAGLAVCSVITQEIGIPGRRFIVFCGLGNNGGDGFVVARKLHSDGGNVQVFVLGDRTQFKGVAKMNLDILLRLPVPLREVDSADAIRSSVIHCDAIVDAIFGTGLDRDVEGLYLDVIRLINESGKTVFSADIPSGISGDTGKIMGAAVKADHTITFGLPKIGNVLFPGYGMCGKLYTTHISFPRAIFTKADLKIEINEPAPIPPRDPEGHKGAFGDVLFIAGAAGYYGAPYLAALSFLKAGGGYARLAAPASITPFIAGKGSEIVFVPQKETAFGSIAFENMDALLALSEKVDMVVLGPGLSLDEETQNLVKALCNRITKPLLIDGDGITAICKDLQIISQRKAQTILTPHLGEMSRIADQPVEEINEHKIKILQSITKSLQATVVLKGAHSLIGYADERVRINMSGNSGMATAGSGDVLTGAIAAMFGLGLPVEDAVSKGVFIHGLAGDLAAQEKGEDGITAQDILDHLPPAVKMDRDGLDDIQRKRYFLERIV